MASYNYSGNNDFRGYLAANYKPLLGFAGNDGGVNWDALNKAGGVDLYQGNSAGNHASYNTKGTSDLIGKLYKEFQTAYNNDLKTTANSASQAAMAALTAQPRLPKFDYSASMAKAQSTAESTINPIYQDKLNQYLEGKKLRVGQQSEGTARNKQDIASKLTDALFDTSLSRDRTAEDTTNKLGDINANENSFQVQEGRAFDQARTALLGNVSDAGLTESGVGQGQVQTATTDRNLASEDTTRGFANDKRDTEIFKSRTLADLDTTDTRTKAGAARSTEEEDIALRNFIDTEDWKEKQERADQEVGRVTDINNATNSAYSGIVAQTIASLVGSGARPQDIALFKQIYG